MTSERAEPKTNSALSERRDEVAAPIDFAVRAKLSFPVVGIGASAGGLEAFRKEQD